jgi:protein-S-isoprenylcysteine O-methyltransferase Ste14
MKVNVGELVLRLVLLWLIVAVLLFVPAGTMYWPVAWVFLGLLVVFQVALTLWMFKYSPGLLDERMVGLQGERRASGDALVTLLVGVVFVVWLAFVPLDAVRYHWSHVPLLLQIIGAVILVSSYYLFFIAYQANPYMSPAARIQEDRGQTVISSGPYAYVRHPTYTGVLLLVLGTTLMLGSWYGLIPGFIVVALFARRALLEENMLRQELAGYSDYMARVKYRLIPLVW